MIMTLREHKCKLCDAFVCGFLWLKSFIELEVH